MSWWVYLNSSESGEPLPVESHTEGGTYAVGGIDRAELNVTYNYAGDFYKALGFNFRELSGRRAGDVVGDLVKAVALLGTERDGDYWSQTDGNAGYVLSILLDWARQHPDGVFEVS